MPLSPCMWHVTTLGISFQAPCSHFSGTGKLWQTLGNSVMIQEPCRRKQTRHYSAVSLNNWGKSISEMTNLPKVPWTMDMSFNGVDSMFRSMCSTPDLENQNSLIATYTHQRLY